MAVISGIEFKRFLKENPNEFYNKYKDKTLWVFAYNISDKITMPKQNRIVKITEVRLSENFLFFLEKYKNKKTVFRYFGDMFQTYKNGKKLKKTIPLTVYKGNTEQYLSFICDTKEEAEKKLIETILEVEREKIQEYKQFLLERLKKSGARISEKDLLLDLKSYL